MNVRRLLVLLVTHGAALAAGFAAGIYALPILTAPEAPADAEVATMANSSRYSGRFDRDRADSDALHWGEGEVFVGDDNVALQGRLAPGPDYMLYLSPTFVETEKDFVELKPTMALVGPVKTFENFIVSMPPDVDPDRYDTVIVWCESFGQFITSARYK